MSALGVANVTDFDGFWLQVQNSGLAPTFYVDDITLLASLNPPTLAIKSCSIETTPPGIGGEVRIVRREPVGIAFAGRGAVGDRLPEVAAAERGAAFAGDHRDHRGEAFVLRAGP